MTQWASCFRARTTVNTNMFVESFHRVLKVVYLQHKQNRRVDFLLATLMKMARDKSFERLLKQEKGKHTHRVCEIKKSTKLLNKCKQVSRMSIMSVRTYGK